MGKQKLGHELDRHHGEPPPGHKAGSRSPGKQKAGPQAASWIDITGNFLLGTSWIEITGNILLGTSWVEITGNKLGHKLNQDHGEPPPWHKLGRDHGE